MPTDDVAYYLMDNGTLQLLLVNTSVGEGSTMFVEDSQRLGLAQSGVPRLDISDDYLVGSADIPVLFPSLIADGLKGGGIGWPAVPGIEAAVAPFETSAATSPNDDTATTEGDTETTGDDEDGDAAILPAGTDGSPLDKIGRDPVGNGLAIVVLIVLLLSLITVPLLAVRGRLASVPAAVVPVLAIAGMAVAAYLATIETSGAEAVCGPVGDCNAVQESQYASLAGIPIGVLGMLAYLGIGALWAVSRVSHGRRADWARVLMALGAFGGVLFSTYLTFLEPFVIGATCMWCLSSAAIMLALLWVTAGEGWDAFERLRGATPSGGHRADDGQPSASAAASR
jgi:uncharacterized membrane protein